MQAGVRLSQLRRNVSHHLASIERVTVAPLFFSGTFGNQFRRRRLTTTANHNRFRRAINRPRWYFLSGRRQRQEAARQTHGDAMRIVDRQPVLAKVG